jgi:aldose 1-epimerase
VAIRDQGGLEAVLCGHGARLVSLSAPDGAGGSFDAVLGYPDLSGYLAESPEMGAVAGRFAGRIAKGRFKLGGKTYSLAQNEGANHLHGGLGGTMRRIFGVYQEKEDEAVFRARLADGEDGYPGNLDLAITYSLPGEGRLRIAMVAATDKPTPVNLVSHAYFNLSSDETIDGHYLEIRASRYAPVGPDMIPLGQLAPVEGTPFDFTAPARLGERINAGDRQLLYGRGFDHTFALDKSSVPNKYGESLAAALTVPGLNRRLEIWTTEPALQLYTANRLGQGRLPGRRPLVKRAGVCLEAQRFPDSPNQAAFPQSVITPGKPMHSSTSLVFGTGR